MAEIVTSLNNSPNLFKCVLIILFKMVGIVKPVLIDVSLSFVDSAFVLEYSDKNFVISRVNNAKKDFFEYAPSIKHRLDYIQCIIKNHPQKYFLKNFAFVEPQEVFYAIAGFVDAVKSLDYRINVNGPVRVERISGNKLDIAAIVEVSQVTGGWFEGCIDGSYADLLRTRHDQFCPNELKVSSPKKIVFTV